MIRTPIFAGWAVAAIVLSPADSGAGDVPITPVEALRDVNVIVTVSDPPDWESVSDQALTEEFGPLAFDRQFSLGLPTAVSEGRGVHVSDIGTAGIEAQGMLESWVQADFGGAASVISRNEFRVTFTIGGPGEYTLQGYLTAFDEGTCAFQLLGAGVNEFFSVSDDSIPLDLSGPLAPGPYFLYALLEGTVGVDGAEVDSAAATASFAFDFSLDSPMPVEPRSWGELKGSYR